MGLVFTKQISNTTFVLETTDGVSHLSVKNSSASAQNITVVGTLTLNGLAPAAVTLTKGEILTLSSDTPLNGVTVTSGSVSALADLIATQ